MLSVAQESPRQDAVLELLCQSDAFAQALYPPESNHLADVDALAAPNVRFFVARLDDHAVGCGAVVLGERGYGEIKRMFVAAVARGQGAGRAILNAIEDAAAREQVRCLQLETGIYNRDALALYRRCGYRERGPFGSYKPDPLSVFMEKVLRAE